MFTSVRNINLSPIHSKQGIQINGIIHQCLEASTPYSAIIQYVWVRVCFVLFFESTLTMRFVLQNQCYSSTCALNPMHRLEYSNDKFSSRIFFPILCLARKNLVLCFWTDCKAIPHWPKCVVNYCGSYICQGYQHLPILPWLMSSKLWNPPVVGVPGRLCWYVWLVLGHTNDSVFSLGHSLH